MEIGNRKGIRNGKEIERDKQPKPTAAGPVSRPSSPPVPALVHVQPRGLAMAYASVAS
jgi:hypothetical protein